MEREYKILADEFEKANVRICELQWCLEKEVSQKKELDQLYRGTQNEIQVDLILFHSNLDVEREKNYKMH